MLDAEQLMSASKLQRKAAIMHAVGDLNCDEIERARRISGVFNSFLPDYLRRQISADLQRAGGSILDDANLNLAFASEIDQFRPMAIESLRDAVPDEAQLVRSSKNVYEMAGAAKLTFANKATRTLNTKLGLLWERLADNSPYVINPEAEFGLALSGIDLIARNFQTGVIEYQQLKTQHNTLTGSQKSRSVSELSIHENPVFCACFANGNWTFYDSDIPKVSGQEFWSRIGISYPILFENVRNLILDLEAEYVRLLQG